MYRPFLFIPAAMLVAACAGDEATAPLADTPARTKPIEVSASATVTVLS